jgi:hypothetical protein
MEPNITESFVIAVRTVGAILNRYYLARSDASTGNSPALESILPSTLLLPLQYFLSN